MRFKDVLLWLETHRDVGYALIRIFLGVALFIRGAVIMTGASAITDTALEQGVGWMIPYVIVAHLLGGLLLTLGCLTRIAALIQIPVLLGAVFLIHLDQGLASAGQSLELAALVLFLLAVFFVAGSGPLAVDNRVKVMQLDRVGGRVPWLGEDYERAYAVIRMYLGIALFVRGWILIADSSAIAELAADQNIGWLYSFTLIHYIYIAHLVGGLMLAAGLLTRVAALVQIPVLIGAVFLVHSDVGLASEGQSLELSVLVLFLLAVFLAFGSGIMSLDGYTPREETVAARPSIIQDGESYGREEPYDREEEPFIPEPAGPYAGREIASEATATLAPPVTVRRPAPDRQPEPAAAPALRRADKKPQLGLREYFISLLIALPFFLYRGLTFLLDPSATGANTLIVGADWVLSYFVLPFFLAITALWLIKRARHAIG